MIFNSKKINLKNKFVWIAILLTLLLLFLLRSVFTYPIKYFYYKLPLKLNYYISYILTNDLDKQFTYLDLMKDYAEIKHKGENKLISLLRTQIQKYPKNPYNSSYYSMLGDLYSLKGADMQSLYFYKLASTQGPHNISPVVSYNRLVQMDQIEQDVERKILYQNLMLDYFEDKLENKEYFLYNLSLLYDKLARWDEVYALYDEIIYLHNFGSKNHEKEDYYNSIYFRNKRKHSAPTKTWADVTQARQSLYGAILTGITRRINALKAPGFFSTQWEEAQTDSNAQIPTFNIATILARSNFSADSGLKPYSNENIVLWTTYGWERVGTWHMVFRKITQPDTIELNGRWEWAGIYFGVGNKLFVYDIYDTE